MKVWDVVYHKNAHRKVYRKSRWKKAMNRYEERVKKV